MLSFLGQEIGFVTVTRQRGSGQSRSLATLPGAGLRGPGGWLCEILTEHGAAFLGADCSGQGGILLLLAPARSWDTAGPGGNVLAPGEGAGQTAGASLLLCGHLLLP